MIQQGSAPVCLREGACCNLLSAYQVTLCRFDLAILDVLVWMAAGQAPLGPEGPADIRQNLLHCKAAILSNNLQMSVLQSSQNGPKGQSHNSSIRIKACTSGILQKMLSPEHRHTDAD